VNREGPEPIDAVAGRMATVIGRTRRANLDAAWELGACFEGALSGADEHRRSRVAKELRRALADRGCDVGLSTLYAYRHVHRAFARERLPELAEDGLTLSHVTILAALDEPLRAAVWSRLEDDGIPPVRDFRALVADRRREVVLRDAAGVAAPADEAPPARIAEAGAPPPATGGTADDGAAPAPVRPASREARPAGLVITERGEREEEERDDHLVSEPPPLTPPLPAIRAADRAAVQLLSKIGRLLAAADAAPTWSPDRASARRLLEALGSLANTLETQAEALPEIRRRIEDARRRITESLEADSG